MKHARSLHAMRDLVQIAVTSWHVLTTAATSISTARRLQQWQDTIDSGRYGKHYLRGRC
jgi:hypothetical protein